MNQNKDMNLEEPYVVKNDSTYERQVKKRIPISNIITITIASIVSVVVVVFFIIGMIKSYNRSKYKDEFYVQQETIQYLQERYDEEFIVYYERGMSGAYNYVQLYAYPIAQQDEAHEIKIQGHYNKWGKMDFYDDYVMVRLTEEYEAYIDPIIDKYFDEYKFYIDFYSEWLTNDLPADTQLEDLWNMQANVDYPLPSFFICTLSDNNKSEIYDDLCAEMRDAGARGRVKIWEMQESNKYILLNRENWDEIKTYNDIEDIATIFLYDNKIERTN